MPNEHLYSLSGRLVGRGRQDKEQTETAAGGPDGDLWAPIHFQFRDTGRRIRAAATLPRSRQSSAQKTETGRGERDRGGEKGERVDYKSLLGGAGAPRLQHRPDSKPLRAMSG